MKKLAFASAAAAALAVAGMSSAFAGTTLQGPRLTGVAPQFSASDKPTIVAVSPPSDNTGGMRKANGSQAVGGR
ncbi:MAG TPA: hypothetical protein VFQ82_04505 [Stellaceae bacterium]|jgi:hypothetical protein|nr:hypothetical protein [Stellaceae bacterium]